MKLSLPRVALAGALEHVRRIAKPGHHPVTMDFILRATKTELAITATDFDVEATVSAPASIEVEGAATVPAEAFEKLVARLPAKAELTLEWFDGPPRVEIRAGRSCTALPSLDPALHAPFAPIEDLAHRFELPGAVLATLLRDAAWAAPKNAARGSELFGVCLHHDPAAGILAAAATDTHVLARSITPAPDGCAGMPRAILPLATVAEIISISEAAGDALVAVALTGSLIEVTGAGATFKSKLIEGRYPPYEAVLARAGIGSGSRLVVSSDDLSQALSRAELVANPKGGSGVRFDITTESLTVLVTGAGGASVVEEIDAEYPAPASFSVGSVVARSILRALGSDVVHAEVASDHKTIWTRPGDGRLLCLLMPRIAV